MNDEDFTYPTNFSEDNLRKSIKLHEKSNNNNCNLYEDKYIVIKNIKIGDPITKKYSLDQWFIWLALDIKKDNPFVTNKRKSSLYYGRYVLPDYNMNKEEQTISLNILIKIAKEYGYILEYNDENRMPKISNV
jgi:hypothetical protein